MLQEEYFQLANFLSFTRLPAYLFFYMDGWFLFIYRIITWVAHGDTFKSVSVSFDHILVLV